jgi:hypothetical protein
MLKYETLTWCIDINFKFQHTPNAVKMRRYYCEFPQPGTGFRGIFV